MRKPKKAIPPPSAHDAVKIAVANLKAAERAADEASLRSEEKHLAVRQAKEAIAKVFLDLYNALPTDARNKVRHAINTSANSPRATDSDDEPSSVGNGHDRL